MTRARNIAIVLVLALAVAVVPGAANVGAMLGWLLTLVLYGALGWFASVLYRQHRASLYGLGDQTRTMLYIALGVVVVTLVASQRLWSTAGGTVLWLALLAGAALALVEVVRRVRQY